MNYYKQQGRCNSDYNSECSYNTNSRDASRNSRNMMARDYSCPCDNEMNKGKLLDCLALGIAYVPWQDFSKPLCAEEGLENGTIFSDLVFPFYGCGYKKVRGSR